MTVPADSLTLDALCQDATRLLQKHGLLDAQTDGRVSDAPDARTVRYYTTMGLVDRPRIVDREARYGWRQVLQVLVIKALQHQGKPLAQIQAQVYGRSEAELEAILRGTTTGAPRRRPALKTVTVREVVLEPGLRLLVEDGFAASDPDALVARFRAALAALSASNGGSSS